MVDLTAASNDMKTGHLMGDWDPENRFFISAFAKAGSDDDPQECLKVAELPHDGIHPLPPWDAISVVLTQPVASAIEIFR